MWSYPKRALETIGRFDCVITPDFSLYRDWPLAIQLWNTYRNRWLGAWWFSHGFQVIPSVNWSTEASYEFCFEGLPVGGSVAVATMEIHQADSLGQRLFLSGFKEMLRRCRPELVLVYGQGFPGKLEELASIKRYPHRLTQVHQRINSRK